LLVGPPHTPNHPCSPGKALGGGRHLLRQALRIGHLQEVDSEQKLSGPVEVGVIVDEAGREESSLEVHELGVLTPKRHDLPVGTHRHDDVAPHGHRLGPGTILVPGPHATRVEDKVG
jgi:hypothetical protein